MKNINVIKCFVTILLLVICNQYINSQNVPSNNSILQNDLKLFNAPSTTSPERAAFEKFGYYPVDFSVGVPNITIPIYTIESGSLNFPITLSYHLSGIKVDEIANWVGLGWSLNAYGAINITCDGLNEGDSFRDLKSCQLTGALYKDGKAVNNLTSPISEKEFYKYDGSATLNNEVPYSSMMYAYINPIEREVLPTKAREYTYNANDMSGYFTYNIDRELVQVPLTDRKINLSNRKCIITTETGDRYFFETKQDVKQKGSFDTFKEKLLSEDMLLTQIVSANNTDTIKFYYTSSHSYMDSKESFSFFAGKDWYATSQGVWGTGIATFETEFYSTNGKVGWDNYSNECLLSSIEFKSGIIEFTLGKRENDKIRDNQLNSISIWAKESNNQKRLLRKVSFEYTSKGDARLFLDKLNIMGDKNDKVQEYKFSYHNGSSSYKSTGQDYWGYFNGKGLNISLVPKKFVPENSDVYKRYSSQMADREPNEKEMKKGSLRRIDYPTGGYTMFDTEAHRDENDNILGGLRVFRIVSKASSESPEVIQKFSYENPFVLFRPKMFDYILIKYGAFYRDFSPYTIDARSYYIDNPSTVSSYKGAAITYEKVTKVDIDKDGGVNGKTVYHYQKPSMYNKIYKQEFNETFGADIRTYHSMPNLWKMGKQTRVEYYKANESIPIKIENYQYQTFREKSEEIGFLLSSSLYQFKIGYGNLPNSRNARDYKRFYWYYANTGVEKLISKQDSVYDAVYKQYITTQHTYEYQNILKDKNINYLLTKELLKDSQGNIIQTTYKYPHDFINSGSIYSSMITNNMISLPIEKIIEKGNKGISKSKIGYGLFPLILPNSLYASKQGSPYELEFTYDSYNKYGNLTQMTNKKEDISTSFIWGYKGKYLIAEIKNGQYKDISNILTESILNNIVDLAEPSETHLKAVNNLRQNPLLTNSLISTYRYKPLIGIKEMTSPGGTTTYYDYDSFGRLKLIKDSDQKLLSTNEYKYSNKRFDEDRLSLEPLNVDAFRGNLVCDTNSEQEYWLSISGGTKNYVYNWTIKDSTGRILKTTTNGRLTMKFPSKGDYIITCVIQDQQYNLSRFITKTVQVRDIIEFKNSKTVQSDSYTQKTTAILDCPFATTITFELRFDEVECDTYDDYYNIEFLIGNNRYKFYKPTRENVKLTLPKGSTTIEISIKDKGGCGQGFGILEIKSLNNSTALVGINSRLINSFVH